MNITQTIRPGQIVINSIERVIDHPDVQIFEVDLASKYAETTCSSGGPHGMTVYLYAGTHTIHIDKSAPAATAIDLEGHDFTGWSIVIDGMGRYTIRICLYLDPRGRAVR